MSRPLVAISEGFADYGDYYGFGYGRAVLAGGGLPVLLPYLEDEADREELLQRVDGLILAGGRDIESWRYGRQVPHPSQGATTPVLDEVELWYARRAVESAVPLLGVCRGCQVLNVAFGGTLYGDLDEFPEAGVDHPGAKWAEWRALVAATLDGSERPAHPTHPVDVEPTSMLADHLGVRTDVDSYHHQAIERVGEGLVAVARAPYGVVEAVEMPDAPAFVLGVQWEIHEEWQEDPRMLGIWREFVAATDVRASGRVALVVAAR